MTPSVASKLLPLGNGKMYLCGPNYECGILVEHSSLFAACYFDTGCFRKLLLPKLYDYVCVCIYQKELINIWSLINMS